MTTRRIPMAWAALLALPALVAAQPRAPRAPRPPAERPALQVSPTELLDRRRELDLSPRQVARLDSLERAMIARRRGTMEQMRQLRDSVCPPQQRCDLNEGDRRAMRDRMTQLRGRGFDTTLSRQTLSVLDSTQRGRIQGMRMGRGGERQAMRRGAMGPRDFGPGNGRRMGPRGPQGRGFNPPGLRGGPGGPGDRWTNAPRERRGFMDAPWERRGFMDAPRERREFMDAPRGRGRFMDDGFDGPRPRRPLPPRRGDDDLTPPTPPDTSR